MQRRGNIRGAARARMALDSAVQGSNRGVGSGLPPAHRVQVPGVGHGIRNENARSVAGRGPWGAAGEVAPGWARRRMGRWGLKPRTDVPPRGSRHAAQPGDSPVTPQ